MINGGLTSRAPPPAFASEVTFAAGDRFAVIAPGSQDASLADISISFKGTRT
jgi:hypothetical protein